jgi:hypothetical protein
MAFRCPAKEEGAGDAFYVCVAGRFYDAGGPVDVAVDEFGEPLVLAVGDGGSA